MDLKEITIHGFKKFEDKTHIKIDTFLTALIGANESGKSSILEALECWNTKQEFTSSGSLQQTTKRTNIPNNQTIISATFLLEDDDKEAINDIDHYEQVKKYSFGRKKDGSLYWNLFPEIQKDFRKRKNLARIIEKATKNSKLEFNNRFSSDEIESETTLFADLKEILNSDQKYLVDKQLSIIKVCIKAFYNLENDPNYIKNFSTHLNELLEYEEINFDLEISDALDERLPKFRLFDVESRNIKGDYDLAEENIRSQKGLLNLLSLANLNLNDLLNCIESGQKEDLDILENNANEKLKAEFSIWSQSQNAIPRLRIEGNILSIFVGNVTIEQHSYEARSAGLRQFIALLAFVRSFQGNQDNILMIDEVETHLHYDAQADYIQFLNNTGGEFAKNIIYTTHSLGSLPNDLGMGVKIVKPIESNGLRSKIINKFWTNAGDKGITPIIFGLGASMLSFLPIRNAVICEGAVDHILYPAIFREANGIDRISFQIVPGLSQLANSKIPIVDNQASKTAYLVDHDGGGLKLKDNLINLKVHENLIYVLPKENTQIENYIDKKIYKRAIDSCIKEFTDSEEEYPISKITNGDRNKSLEGWCKEHNISVPDKVAVASKILDIVRNNEPILDKNKKDLLANLYTEIVSNFEGTNNT